ncbi:hypothetical protein AT01_3908 [Yersinia aldovae 670-83]|nr:hypothetical protein AT01_3908 [Yersinia aldovae 670-83]
MKSIIIINNEIAQNSATACLCRKRQTKKIRTKADFYQTQHITVEGEC